MYLRRGLLGDGGVLERANSSCRSRTFWVGGAGVEMLVFLRSAVAGAGRRVSWSWMLSRACI